MMTKKSNPRYRSSSTGITWLGELFACRVKVHAREVAAGQPCGGGWVWRCVMVLSPLTAPQNRTASASSVGALQAQAQAQASFIRHIHTTPPPRLTSPYLPACCFLNNTYTATLTREAPFHQQAAHDFLRANQAAYDIRGQTRQHTTYEGNLKLPPPKHTNHNHVPRTVESI
jgi:hypothetical protein